MNKLDELWVPVKGFENIYEISNGGNVRSLIKSEIRYGKKLPCILNGSKYSEGIRYSLVKNETEFSIFGRDAVLTSFGYDYNNIESITFKDGNVYNHALNNLTLTYLKFQCENCASFNRQEKFVDICGGKYKVSDCGRVLSRFYQEDEKAKRLARFLKPKIDNYGYYYYNLYQQKKPITIKIHRLVAIHFLPNPQNLPSINHKDGNKLNNFCENLEWCTHQENIKHAVDMGLLNNRGEKSVLSKLKNNDAFYIRSIDKSQINIKQLCEQFKVSQNTIRRVLSHETYKY